MDKITKIAAWYPSYFLLSSIVPLVASAQTQNIEPLVRQVINIANAVISILFLIATLIFLWGVIQFIAKSGDEKAQASAKGIMLWGIIGLAVMAAAWGIVQILVRFFGVGGVGIPGGTGSPIPLPQQN